MASLKSLATGRGDLFKIDPAIIQVDPNFNVRRAGPEREARINEMMMMVAAQGILTPLKVRMRGDDVVVVQGHTRLEAVRRLNENNPGQFVTVPCIAEAPGTTDAERSISLWGENESSPLTAVEKADLIKRQLNVYGWSMEEIAAKAGVTEKQVANLLALSGASEEVKEMVSSGEVSATTAIQVIKKEGTKAATAVIQQAVTEAKANGKAKATAKTMKAPKAPTSFLSDLLSGAPTTPVEPTPKVKTNANTQVLLDTLNQLLELDDVAVMHTVIRQTLEAQK